MFVGDVLNSHYIYMNDTRSNLCRFFYYDVYNNKKRILYLAKIILKADDIITNV